MIYITYAGVLQYMCTICNLAQARTGFRVPARASKGDQYLVFPDRRLICLNSQL